MRKRVLLISFFNSTNIGDQAICKAVCNMLSNSFDLSVLDISGRAYNPDLIKSKMNSVTEGNNKRSALYSVKCLLSLFKPSRLTLAESMIKSSDTILLAGGNMIMDMDSIPLYSYLCYQYGRIAKKFGKKVLYAYVGVGVIKNRTEKYLWKKALLNADSISVRDNIAKEKMVSLGIPNEKINVWCDPVFSLYEKSDGNNSSVNNSVGINIYVDAVNGIDKKNKLKSAYIELIEKISAYRSVVLFSTEKQDEQYLKEIYGRVKYVSNVSVEQVTTYDSLVALYGKVDAVIATRMHSMIIALANCLPVVVLSWQDKIDGLVSDLEIAERKIPIEDFCNKPNMAFEKLNLIFANYYNEKNLIVALMESESKYQADYTSELIDRITKL